MHMTVCMHPGPRLMAILMHSRSRRANAVQFKLLHVSSSWQLNVRVSSLRTSRDRLPARMRELRTRGGTGGLESGGRRSSDSPRSESTSRSRAANVGSWAGAFFVLLENMIAQLRRGKDFERVARLGSRGSRRGTVPMPWLWRAAVATTCLIEIFTSCFPHAWLISCTLHEGVPCIEYICQRLCNWADICYLYEEFRYFLPIAWSHFC